MTQPDQQFGDQETVRTRSGTQAGLVEGAQQGGAAAIAATIAFLWWIIAEPDSGHVLGLWGVLTPTFRTAWAFLHPYIPPPRSWERQH